LKTKKKADPNSDHKKNSSQKTTTKAPAKGLSESRQLPFWKKVIVSIAAIVLFYGLLEGVLAVFGVQPKLLGEDPFVGFASNVPLFLPETDLNGRQVFVTASNKNLFNHQQFPQEKLPGTYRIFCVGGSTTYGRPYNDTTSFAGWLRELLPAVDTQRRWEVINAGGISYASYRVARLMQELAQYQPDLFIVYSGHNEFLEERSYRALRSTPSVVKSLAALLARTRTWAAMSLLLDRVGLISSADQQRRVVLPGEVDTMLRRFGPDIYERNDTLRDQILLHYQDSLRRMVDIAESANADILFIVPASNQKDSSPFKSQHTEGINRADRLRVKGLLTHALKEMRQSRWSEAIESLNTAIEIDPRFAELHYRKGKALFALGRYEEAKTAFAHARDEDICPLRALSTMREKLAQVTRATGSPTIDFVSLLEQHLLAEKGHNILGEEYFLDHVHPTIEGNRMLAVKILELLIKRGVVKNGDVLNDQKIAAIASRIEGRLDPQMRARALTNLAKVLAWAGKIEDARRPASQALAFDVKDPTIVSDAAMILAKYHGFHEDTDKAKQYFRMALNAEPRNPEVHFQIGLQLSKSSRPDLEMAAAHIFYASVFWAESHRDMLHQILGRIMAQRKNYAAAFSNLLEARRLNPDNPKTASLLARIRDILGPEAQNITPPKVALKRHPSGAPRRIAQVRLNTTGRYIAEGIWTEWYENGLLKRFADYTDGRINGVELTLDPNGQINSRTIHRP
jgi:tetratricopeptide (TPR) repeat protein